MPPNTKRFHLFRCKGCGFEYQAKPIAAYEATHFCPKKREHVVLVGVEEEKV